MQKAFNNAHHLFLLAGGYFSYAMWTADKLPAVIIGLGTVGLWAHAHFHTHES